MNPTDFEEKEIFIIYIVLQVRRNGLTGCGLHNEEGLRWKKKENERVLTTDNRALKGGRGTEREKEQIGKERKRERERERETAGGHFSEQASTFYFGS